MVWFLGTQGTRWADLTDVSGIRVNMAPNGVWLLEWFLLLLPNIVQTNMKVVFRTGASVWWVCLCTMSAVSEERC